MAVISVSWRQLLRDIEECDKCPLRKGCKNVVPGEGYPLADVMLIGEGPGAEEDKTGRPFVGRAGELLSQMLHDNGIERLETYICNVVKCRPPGNRTPTPEEAEACKPYLRAQVALVRPKIIMLLGTTAGRATLGNDYRVSRDRGQWVYRKGVWMMGTYHPAALLRDESLKQVAREDFRAMRIKLRELQRTQEE